MENIIFTKVIDVIDDFFPVPASKVVPDWYKDLDSYVSGVKKPSGDGTTTGTIKRCMPVFDSITAGYIIPTYVDLFISQKEQPDENGNFITSPWYEWPSHNPIEFHPIQQAPTHPNKGGHTLSFPKWINPWSIKTPPGYSCLFTAPFHRPSIFTVLTGIVDTDTYTAPVNFPFVLNDATFEGLIPAGTPLVQVIPFKRDEWKMAIGSESEKLEQEKVTSKLKTRFFDSYKQQFRQVKDFR